MMAILGQIASSGRRCNGKQSMRGGKKVAMDNYGYKMRLSKRKNGSVGFRGEAMAPHNLRGILLQQDGTAKLPLTVD
jgi:hypothetical protein